MYLPEVGEILRELDMPGFEHSLTLWRVGEPIAETPERLNTLLRIRPRDVSHRLHQLEVVPLVVGQAGHVAQLGDQHLGKSLTWCASSLIPQCGERYDQRLLQISYGPVVLVLVVVYKGDFPVPPIVTRTENTT